uniref:Uncharacterized protein n=1 Tax=uncultured prokaryote TaxID=198431 RepID=A0A0H5Q3V8_9ZZZZ|nr:hypothetical protein [uncultured prokaryote]
MATLIIPDTFLVAIKAISSGQDNVAVIGIIQASGTSAGVASAVKAAWEAAGGPLSKRPSQYQMDSYTVTDLSVANGSVVTLGSTAVGGISTTSLSTNGACALVRFSAGTRSRSESGRMYHGPLAESQINSDGRTVDAATLTGLQSAYTQFQTSLAGGGNEMVVISRKYQSATLVSQISVSNIIATQRRRIRG